MGGGTQASGWPITVHRPVVRGMYGRAQTKQLYLAFALTHLVCLKVTHTRILHFPGG